MENELYNRSRIIYGQEKIDKLKNSSVIICGIGGVGSYVLEALTRVGIGSICIIDKDIVDATNKNRQIIALDSTVGMDKVEVAKKRCIDINKNVNIISIKDNISEFNINNIIGSLDNKYDYIVDCVDNVSAKIAIIVYANENNINCISSMGFANKVNPLEIKVDDIYKTSTCPLAKVVRKQLRSKEILKQKVVYSTELQVKTETDTLGSVSFVPSVAGLVIASEVVKDIVSD